jgi:hypothetical protein
VRLFCAFFAIKGYDIQPSHFPLTLSGAAVIDVIFEKGASVTFRKEITIAILKGGRPNCGDNYRISITFKTRHEEHPVVNNVCHPEFIEALNKRLRLGLQLRMSP